MIKKITLSQVNDRFVIEIVDNTKPAYVYSIDTVDAETAIESVKRYL